MHKPYTKQAQKVIELTTKAARSMHHNYIGTEHHFTGIAKRRQWSSCLCSDGCGSRRNPSGRTDRRFIAPSSDVAVLDRKGYSPGFSIF